MYDPPSLDEQRQLIEAGCKLHLALWKGRSRRRREDTGHSAERTEELFGLVEELPQFHNTHRGMWLLAQLSGLAGLKSTVFSRSDVNPAWQTWEPPRDLREGDICQLIKDMPSIMSSLMDSPLIAFGHNDLVSDNAYVCEGELGLFDWQQACVNHVGQEWAWNFHWLPPAFLTSHESTLIEMVLTTYEKGGRRVERKEFMRGYVLGCVQMFVWGGGGLHILMKALGRSGHFQRMEAGKVIDDPEQAEKLLGAEMTRRTFTNCCNIMTRHDFVGMWKEWRAARGEANTNKTSGTTDVAAYWHLLLITVFISVLAYVYYQAN